MAACPSCRAVLAEPAAFCGACGRRLAPSEADAPERPAAAIDSAAATIEIPPGRSRARPLDGDDPSESMLRAIAPVGPRLLKLGAFAAAMGGLGAVAALSAWAVSHPGSPPAPSTSAAPIAAAPARADAPPAPAPAPIRHHRSSSTVPHEAPAVVAAAALPAPSTAPAPSAAPAPSIAPAPSSAPGPASAPAPSAAAPSTAPAAIAPAGDDEPAPPTAEDLAEQRQAAVYADGIRFVVGAHKVQVAECYERAFKDQLDPASGTVEIAFTVGADGRARGARAAANDTGSLPLANCLARRVGEWTFPRPPSGEFRASYPFVFSRGAR